MLTLQDVGYDIAGRWLYRNVTWQLQPGERSGLIGKNGTGKTTLLKLMVGDYRPTEGQVVRSNDLKIGFLRQELLEFRSESTAFEVAREAFADVMALEEELLKVTDNLANDFSEAALERMADLQTRFEQADGYTIDARTHEILGGLGFEDEVRHRPFNTFSGGWRMRVLLAQLLLQKPDVLLLDEPTNHLDLPSIAWLESYLQSFPGAVIVVSHDRYFLDRLITSVVEVRNQKVHFYSGNYSRFEIEREERIALQTSAYENQQKQIEQTERLINRFKAKASKASQAQSWMKQLDKLERVDAPDTAEAVVNIRFTPAQPSGKEVVRLQGIRKSYDDVDVLDNADATVYRGEKIGLIGANGIGKSTLLRIIAGIEPVQAGTHESGYNVLQVLYAQHQIDMLRPTDSIWDSVQKFARETNDTYVRTVLGCFLFSGDDIHKRISVLSGGEKARVALCKNLLTAGNFLLLDEPTNHLDIQSIDILIQALRAFDGTYIVISHDRHFLSQVTDQIWYIEDRQLKHYPGGYTEYIEWQARRAAEAKAQSTAAAKVSNPIKQPQPSKVQGNQQTAKPAAAATATAMLPMPLSQNEERKLRNRLKAVETEMETLESKRAEALDALQSPGSASDFAKLAELQASFDKLSQQIDKLTDEWAEIAERLEG
jgi:ATP-binding cassette subfamily F protein 3